jgi:protein deglycase
MRKVALLLADGFEEIEAITPANYLRRAGVDVYLTGVEGLSVTGAHNITFEADVTIEELPHDLDGVVIPGGMPGAANIAASKEALKLIKRIYNDSELVGAICAAPAIVLGAAGLLEGREFTCYPGFETQVKGARFSEESVVRDSNIITSRGPGTAAEFSLALVEYLVGKEKVKDLRQALLLGK